MTSMDSMRLVRLALLVAIGVGSATLAVAQQKAFPQAEGYGQYAEGGRGGDVYHVTKLNDDGSAGTLRYGLSNAPSAGRTIVFDVGGWIDLNSKLGVTRDNITIAGQTAPGGGIGVRGNQVSVGADNVVIRHMRFRPGKSAGRVDSLSISSGSDVIFDHVSAAFSYDENASANGADGNTVTNLTMQHSAVAFGLEDHSAGSLIQNAANLSYHHNLYAHNHTRNPKARVEGGGMDWVNNVVYDYNNGFIAGDSDTNDFFWKANVEGNYYITGPGDTGRPIVKDGRVQNYGLYFGTNAYDNDGDATHDGVLYTGNGVNAAGLGGVVSGTYTWSAQRYGDTDVWQDATPQDAYERVLDQFGATPWNRDEVDSLIRDNVANRTGGLIERESHLAGISNGGFGTLAAGAAPLDSDGDGMPNDWEEANGSNPQAASNNADFDQDGYTDLEEYLNDVAAFKATGPLEFHGVGRYADWGRWTRQWEPSRLDDVHVSTGAAFVDAPGQRAGTLTVGAGGGDGRLYVTSGALTVTDNLVVEAGGRVEHHGGEVRVGGDALTVEGEYRLLGGTLSTPALTVESGARFDFAGGVLAVDTVLGDLVNSGGELSVGVEDAHLLNITGDLELADGVLAIELGGPDNSDSLVVTGTATLGGALDVRLTDGFQLAPGESVSFLRAITLAGAFESITPGYEVWEDSNIVRIRRTGAALASVPEPAALGLAVFGVALLAGFRRPAAACGLAAALTLSLAAPTQADTLSVIADTQLSENGTTGLGDATDTGSGASTAINARWNNDNRNEWLALKFDLGAYADKSRLSNLALRPTMYRGNANNSTSLRLYALTPGTAGEDWDEASVTYGSMPGFTFDANSRTNLIDVGGALTDLGSFSVSGYEAEGSLAAIDPGSLTSLVQSMGDNDLLTLLVSFSSAANGQWRIASREATSTDTGAVTGAPGDLAALLEFDVAFGGVLGDYNDDGVVNAADYTVWRDAGGRGQLPNEEVSPGRTDIADYLYWAERYGATDTGLPAQAVPEPAAALMAALAAGVCLSRPRRS